MALNNQVDGILDQVETLVRDAQKRHFNAFLHAGAESYTELAKDLMSLSRVGMTVLKALNRVEEDPRW